MTRKMYRRVQLLILQVLHPRLDQVIFRDGKKRNSNVEWVFWVVLQFLRYWLAGYRL